MKPLAAAVLALAMGMGGCGDPEIARIAPPEHKPETPNGMQHLRNSAKANGFHYRIQRDIKGVYCGTSWKGDEFTSRNSWGVDCEMTPEDAAEMQAQRIDLLNSPNRIVEEK